MEIEIISTSDKTLGKIQVPDYDHLDIIGFQGKSRRVYSTMIDGALRHWVVVENPTN